MTLAPLNNSEIQSLLELLLDANLFQDATKKLKKNLKKTNNYLAVVQCILDSEKSDVKQVSCSFLRERLKSQWTKIQLRQKDDIKEKLLESLLKEQNKSVRSSLISVTATIVKLEMPTNAWPSFMSWLETRIQSSVFTEKELGLQLLSRICELLGKHLRPMYKDLFVLFGSCFQHGEPKICYYAIEAMTSLVAFLEKSEVFYIQPLIEPIISTFRVFLSTDSSQALRAFDFFDSVFDSEIIIDQLEVDLVPIVRFFLEVCSGISYDEDIRISCLAHISWLLENRKKFIIRNNFIETILMVIFPIMCELNEANLVVSKESEQESESEFSDMTSPSEYAAHVLDCLSFNFNPSLIVQSTLSFIMTNCQSNNIHFRLATQVALRTIAEGCSEYIKAQLSSVLPFLQVGLDDPSLKVQQEACLSLVTFSRHLQPEICKYHSEILSRIFSLLNSNNVSIKEKSILALESFCLNLGKDLNLYLSTIINTFIELLRTGPLQIKEAAVYSIGSVAISAEKDFDPFLNLVLDDIIKLMMITGEENATLRSNSIDAMGSIIQSISLEKVSQFIGTIIPLANHNFTLNDYDLDRSTLGLFSSIAIAYKEDFSSQLPFILQHVFRIVSTESHAELEKTTDISDSTSKTDDSGSDSWEDSDYDSDYINKDLYYAKEEALNLLGTIALNLPQSFMPYLQSTIETVSKLSKYSPNNDVRNASFSTLCQYLECYHSFQFGVEPTVQTWNSGIPTTTVLPPEFNSLIYQVMDIAMETFKKSDDSSTIKVFFDSIISPLQKIGPELLCHHIDSWLMYLHSILINKAPFQNYEMDVIGQDNKLAMGEEDFVIIEITCELIAETAKVLGNSFSSFFPTFHKALTEFFLNSTDSEESIYVGTLAEIISGMKSSIEPFAPELYPIFLNVTRKEHCDLRLNGVYGLGLLCQYGGTFVQTKFMECLQVLGPLFSDTSLLNIPDNAVAAVCRMILSSSSLPLFQILPAIFSVLPLKKDKIENETVFSAFFLIYQTQPEQLSNFSESFVQVLAHVLGNVDKELNVCKNPSLIEKIVTMSKSYYQQRPELWTVHLKNQSQLIKYFE